MENKIERIKQGIRERIIGNEATIDLVLAGLFAGGHILLEDMPGTGKTLMAKTLASLIDAEFSRIQFTPDLLPSDITGIHYYQPATGEFAFRRGPVFAGIILADEINRATPRTQSALLECMEEHQVTIDTDTFALSDPFFVIATQNPVETAGTFKLPEASLDRFAMKLSMADITAEEEVMILDRYEGEAKPMPAPVMSTEDVRNLRKAVDDVYIAPCLKRYIVDICQTSGKTPGILSGASPRAALSLMRCAKAYVMCAGREFVTPEDIKYLAPFCLAHRIILKSEIGRQSDPKDLIAHVLTNVTVPTEDWSR
ncbi:MAG: AAA family ATPase [Lachnospiraceae bacterium]|nr:AAA family ATPase [Lachnospiraceae bacterium]